MTEAALLMITVIIIYTLLGGLTAVAWTDTLMLCGMMLAAVVIMGQMFSDVGLTTLITRLNDIDLSLANPSGPYGATKGSVFMILAYATLWATVLPYMGMRFMAFRDDVKMRTVALYAAPMGVVLSLVPLVGLYMRVNMGGIEDSDAAMPTYLSTFLHPAVGAVITLCILHTVSSAVSHDLRYALLPHRRFSPSQALFINRSAVTVLGLIGFLMMLYAPPFLLSWLSILGTGTLLAATVGPVFVSLFWCGNAYGALAAMAVGTVISGGLLLFTEAGWMVGPLVGCVGSSLTYVVVSLATFRIQPRVYGVTTADLSEKTPASI